MKSAYKGKPLDQTKLIMTQRRLMLNNMPQIPDDYIKVLHEYNSLACDGCVIFGISPRDETDLDLITENALIHHNFKTDVLILGWNELEYLIWNAMTSKYQIVDKVDFEVLKTYHTCKDALWDFLKLDDCY